ncbi:MAG TPA: hypothetical protein VFV19_08045 [Candidatus Polarisedimenticolaceae bacterium]|nr:hypothetical protein [Candidatus Polarisedimenticolaceae bacterium]
MKIRTVPIAIALALTSSLFARWSGPVEANVPFAFHVGNKVLPPGDYLIDVAGSISPNALTVRAKNGSEKLLCDTTQIPEREDPEVSGLVFVEIGDTTYLAEVWGLESSGRGVKNMVDGRLVDLDSQRIRRRVAAVRVVE